MTGCDRVVLRVAVHRPFECVEDHREADVELVAKVVAGLKDVLVRYLSEMRVLADGDVASDIGGGLKGSEASWSANPYT